MGLEQAHPLTKSPAMGDRPSAGLGPVAVHPTHSGVGPRYHFSAAAAGSWSAPMLLLLPSSLLPLLQAVLFSFCFRHWCTVILRVSLTMGIYPSVTVNMHFILAFCKDGYRPFNWSNSRLTYLKRFYKARAPVGNTDMMHEFLAFFVIFVQTLRQPLCFAPTYEYYLHT